MLAAMSDQRRAVAWRGVVAAVIVAGCALPAPAAAGGLEVGRFHACALLSQSGVRCWGYGGDGALGYANTATIGDDETPAAAGPVDLGAGHTALTLAAGFVHTCAVLEDHSVRCWGFPGDGRLGYGNVDAIGDNESPSATGPVNLGPGRTAIAIAAGRAHTCAVLDGGAVRCWGFGFDGRLGYGTTDSIGDNEAPAVVGPVNLGPGRTATAIAVGDSHTCALLDNGAVRCWGFAGFGQLGYGTTTTFSDTQTPDTAGPVQLGAGRTAVAISAGSFHTCALLDDATVRCWGFGGDGELGYANTNNVGDDETPASVGPVDLGPGRTAVAIDAGANDTCAVLDDGTVRCWGAGADGRLGYANTSNVGDDETPASAGPVNLGPGRTAVAISAGGNSTCARLDDGSVRCWGAGATGALGYCATTSVGDDEVPGSAGPVALGDPGIPGAGCPPSAAPARPFGPNPPAALAAAPRPPADDGLAAQRARAAGLRDCRATVARRAATQRRRARELPASRRAAAIGQIAARASRDRRACLTRYARTPGRVTSLTARATGLHTIVLTFRPAGTDGAKPPAARRYVVKQSPRPIRTATEFRRAHALCKGTCAFAGARLEATITLRVTNLARRRAYYYALSARDNVTAVPGPRSAVVRARTG
jgi:alpha-tubulin suppressor-like RCC1 family protein